MNCVNHPDTPSVNFCQNCGKPLCAQCVRTVSGMIYCEPCLAARLGVPTANAPQTSGAPGYYPPTAGSQSPILAGLLGFIPGVGAMYNGQFAKGLVHVVIFIALISAAHQFGLFGLGIAAWVFYQVFDAYQTAFALQRGLPVPDPLGLNNIGARLGLGQTPPPPGASPGPYPDAPPAAPSAAAPGAPAAGYTSSYPSAYPAVPPVAPPWDPVAPPDPGSMGLLDEPTHRTLPVGAVVLVALGALFLLGTAGILNTHWIHRGWPLILIGLGVWIFYRNNRSFPGGPQ